MKRVGLVSITYWFAVAMGLLVAGCAHSRPSASSQPSPEAKPWPQVLSEDERTRCKRVAWEAAAAPDLNKRCKLLSIPDEPVKLSDGFIQYYLDQKDFDKVAVAIPSGRKFGWHGCYIGVTVTRGSYKVIVMEESFWP